MLYIKNVFFFEINEKDSKSAPIKAPQNNLESGCI